MKCPLCNAPTDVKQTKTTDGVPIRSRHCFNNHSFKTKEVPITEVRPKRAKNPGGSGSMVAVHKD